MKVKRKHFSDSAEEIGAGLAGGGLGAGVGYLGYRGAKNANEAGRVIGNRLSWKKVGDKQLKTRDRTYEMGIKVEKAGKKISDLAKTRGGKAALIATPAVIAGGTTYLSKRRKRKKSEENN